MKKGLFSTGSTKLKNIFLAPLEAVVQADIEMAKRITEFIMHYGFENWDETESDPLKRKLPKLRMVSFTYINSSGKKEIFSMPVLTLIQLPLLRISDANFDMKVKMVTVDVDEAQTPNLLADPGSRSAVTRRPKTEFRAFVTPETTGTNMETMKSNMKVTLNMRDADMPGGIIQLLAMMSELNRVEADPNEK